MGGCFVPLCPMGRGKSVKDQAKTKDGRRPTLFKPPEDKELLAKWQQAIKRDDKALDSKSKVCELHFTEQDLLIRDAHNILENGEKRKNISKNKIIKLKKGATPSVFNEYPSYLQPKPKKVSRLSRIRQRIEQEKILHNETIIQRPVIARKRRASKSPCREKHTKKSDKENSSLAANATDTAQPENSQDMESSQNAQKEVQIVENSDEETENKIIEAANKDLLNLVDTLKDQDPFGIPFPQSDIRNETRLPEAQYCLKINTTQIENNNEQIIQQPNFLQDTLKNLDKLSVPNGWTKGKDIHEKCLIFTRWSTKNNCVDMTVTMDYTLKPTFQVRNKCVPSDVYQKQVIYNKSKLEQLLINFDSKEMCPGYAVDKYSDQCSQIIISPKKKTCDSCLKKLNSIRSVQCRAKKLLEIQGNNPNRKQRIRRKTTTQRLSQSNWRKKQQIAQLRQTIEDLQEKCAKTPQEVIENEIATLDEGMKETVRACFASAKAKSTKGRRYSQEWIYDCLLMRIKGPALYRTLRNNNKLPLPCIETLRKYTQNLKATYGFQDTIFQMMGCKRSELDPMECHGNLLVDEMMLDKKVFFNKSTLQAQGYVDMGQYTPDNEKDKLGDHGLVFMFQSYTGGWVQNIGWFLTSGAANGEVLHKLIIEAILLLEMSGYYVHGVVTDGAAWNYGMWSQFGVGENKNDLEAKYFCEHPCSKERKLFFFSDFPHLIKNMRNNLLDRGMFKVPDGYVEMKYWDLLVQDEDDPAKAKQLKRCPKFNKMKCRPKTTERMKVSWAFQFYSNSNAVNMQINRETGIEGFKDSEASSEFCKRVNELCDAMNNSRDISLRLKPDSKAEKIIMEFLEFLEKWDNVSKEKIIVTRGKKNPQKVTHRRAYLSEQTSKGLYVTLRSTLGLMTYLIDKYNFKYVLTRRLNQDALEHFFGLVRGMGGSSTHPNSVQFAQLVKLLSLYSLVKPPRGSNVSGAEMLQSLLKCKDMDISSTQERKSKLEEVLDSILLDGEHLAEIPHLLNDHDYLFGSAQALDMFVISYIAGYIARKSLKWCNDCEKCQASLTSNELGPNTRLIELKSKGYLLYPSANLEKIVCHMESAVQDVVTKKNMCRDYLFDLLDALELRGLGGIRVGCDQEGHQNKLTKAVLRFFMMTRMHFLCREECGTNRNHAKHSKLAKL